MHRDCSKPKALQKTLASDVPNESSQTVPQVPLYSTSTRPVKFKPPDETKRTWMLVGLAI